MSTKSALRPTARSPKAALGKARSLVTLYAAVSILTLGAIALLRKHHDLVTDAVWVRGSIVAVTALLMLSFAVKAGSGNKRALLRLRIVSLVMVAVIAVIVAMPGGFPTWMKIEQAVCGVLLLGVVASVNGRRVRAAFAH